MTDDERVLVDEEGERLFAACRADGVLAAIVAPAEAPDQSIGHAGNRVKDLARSEHGHLQSKSDSEDNDPASLAADGGVDADPFMVTTSDVAFAVADLETSPDSQSTIRSVHRYLQRRGADVSTEFVRDHLGTLMDAGIVRRTVDDAGGRPGKPTRLFELTGPGRDVLLDHVRERIDQLGAEPAWVSVERQTADPGDRLVVFCADCGQLLDDVEAERCADCRESAPEAPEGPA